jgi:hypothetical protein
MLASTADGARLEIHVDQPTPELAQVTVRAPVASTAGGPRLGTQVARALAQRQKGTLTCGATPGGGLEAILTLPATHKSPARRTILRPRRPPR